ncbi:cell division protein [Citromicrobium bathyomarinum]|uniref:cell division protein FtsX n=1 Tax=Sphingomonadales TaxID=204457 RepID=UPI000C427486|nr:cell division protein [Citromicrobium sp.]MBO82589.1 cell division protein [Citromicrobium sp.]|tara:strand:+ start:11898 stop:12827 length:930 start_codon:yes stop_codon:yes gene_type:complete
MSTPPLTDAARSGQRSFEGAKAQALIPQARLAGPMPWVLAIMVALTVLAAGAGLSLGNLAGDARSELSGGATVQILQADPATRAEQAQAAQEALQAMAMVEQSRQIPQDELDALLEPWLGESGDAETVPVPALIDVRLEGRADDAAIERLRQRILQVAPDARVDAQSDWLQPVFSALTSLQYVALALVLLLAVTSAAAVFLAARSALGNNRETIEIVHLLGGTDGQIAQLFQRAILRDSMIGGGVGLLLGLAAVLGLGYQFAALDSGMIGGGGLDWLDWILIALIPVLGVVLAVATARFTVLSAVRRML